MYYCQNWRHDVVALVTSGGAMKERVRYTAYGIPIGMPLGDCDGDGDTDATDQAILLAAWGTGTAKCDLDLSGSVARRTRRSRRAAVRGDGGVREPGPGAEPLRVRGVRLGHGGERRLARQAPRAPVAPRTVESQGPDCLLGWPVVLSLRRLNSPSIGGRVWPYFRPPFALTFTQPTANSPPGSCGQISCHATLTVSPLVQGFPPQGTDFVIYALLREDLNLTCCASTVFTDARTEWAFEYWGRVRFKIGSLGTFGQITQQITQSYHSHHLDINSVPLSGGTRTATVVEVAAFEDIGQLQPQQPNSWHINACNDPSDGYDGEFVGFHHGGTKPAWWSGGGSGAIVSTNQHIASSSYNCCCRAYSTQYSFGSCSP